MTPAMRRTVLVVGGVVVLGLAVALWFAFNGAGGGTNGTGTGSDPNTGPSASNSSSGQPSAGPVPGASPTTGSEVLPPSEGGSDHLPPRTPATPLVTAPLPESASLSGGLVAGFPVNIIGPVAGSTVLESSVATEASTMQATLTARTDASPEEVATHYATAWAELGLNGSSQGSGSATVLSYTGAYESISLAFSSGSGTGTVYMIYSVFRTK